MHPFPTAFLINTALLIAVAYLANLIYKYLLSRASENVKFISSILLAIFGGWVSSFFGYRFSETVIFDLRMVPLILATFAYSRSYPLILIGSGIGLARFTFGMNDAAMAGFINLTLLGVLCTFLNEWFRRSHYSIFLKGMIVVVLVNLGNAVNISVFGVIPARTFIMEVLPLILPMGLLLSIGCALLFFDFNQELRRTLQLRAANAKLSVQKDQLEKTQVDLEERAQQLALASQYKSEFLANMSHELRTPLNSILSLAQLISEEDEERTREEIAEYSRLIYKSGQDLLLLINDILDLSKVEAGQLEIVKESMSVTETVQILYATFEVTARKQGLSFEVDIAAGVPDWLISDSHRVNQILRNLLSNAFKFTAEGGVVLRVHLEETRNDRDHPWVVFSVSDTGIGIPQEKQRAIFEAFEQGDASITRKYGGTGLGLSISRELARLLDGTVEVVSSPGTGSTFSLYLPLHRV